MLLCLPDEKKKSKKNLWEMFYSIYISLEKKCLHLSFLELVGTRAAHPRGQFDPFQFCAFPFQLRWRSSTDLVLNIFPRSIRAFFGGWSIETSLLSHRRKIWLESIQWICSLKSLLQLLYIFTVRKLNHTRVIKEKNCQPLEREMTALPVSAYSCAGWPVTRSRCGFISKCFNCRQYLF